jgi:hypothetical protein
MERGDGREVGFEGRFSVVNQHGQGNNEENDQAENCGIRVTWSGYVVVARGTRRPSPPKPQSKMQRKRTGPGAPRAGRSEGKSGETRRFGEGLGKLGICRRLTRRK